MVYTSARMYRISVHCVVQLARAKGADGKLMYKYDQAQARELLKSGRT
jgi:hypothetical protein